MEETVNEAGRSEEDLSSPLVGEPQQPLQWLEWGDAALSRAHAEEKPILLRIHAAWCGGSVPEWMHAPETVAWIQEHFLPVQVDRDAMPELDARMQAVAQILDRSGELPLLAFLTPEGFPFYVDSGLAKQDRNGRSGKLRVLENMAQSWRDHRAQTLESAGVVAAQVEAAERHALRGRGGQYLSLEMVDRIAGAALARFDADQDGFGNEPKLPHPATLDLLLQVAMSRDSEEARDAFSWTLEKMALSGVWDHLAGGFHRASVDAGWVQPRFAKLLCDNTERLRNYVHGFQSLVRPEFLATAQEILGWLDTTMTDRERGGFFASQADSSDTGEEGDYFTWSREELRSILHPEEFEVAARYWEIGSEADGAERRVLRAPISLAELAARICRDQGDLRGRLRSARRRMLAARYRRPAPHIDRTLYTAWNAMAVTAYLEAARVLRMESAREFALLTLTRILEEAWDGASALTHVIAWADGEAAPDRLPGTLEDYACTIHACIDGWLGSGRMEFYHAAVRLADAMIEQFYDRSSYAFNDTSLAEDRHPLGLLQMPRWPVQDGFTPAGNPMAAAALMRLETLSGRLEYRRIAQQTLLSFAVPEGRSGLGSGTWALAVERLMSDPVQVIVVGSGAEAARLEALAVARYAINKTVMRIAPFRLVPDGIPPALADMLHHYAAPQGTDVYGIVCRGRTCLPLITEAEELLEALEG